ncbi:MAG: J domain-containing protein [Microscillaceae bacterium]|jgi:DnaJ-domain-containing protein 1|nr:J domain-containing protein [Microscillaceae bacterium]
MLTKMLMEIFQAIIEDPTIQRMLGNYDLNKNKDKDVEQMMDELGLNAEQRAKFREAYKDYQKNPNQSYEKYKYKYEPKSDSPFDKFDAYFNKFEDYAKETEEKYGKGTGDWRHREYAKYRNQSNESSSNSQKKSSFVSDEEKKHLQSLELKEGATFDEIKAAYKAQMKKYHPDKFSDPTQKKYAESLSQRINQAYDYFKKKFDQK